MDNDGREEEDGVKVHEIKFDEYGIMADGLDDDTNTLLAKNKNNGRVLFKQVYGRA